MNNITKHNPNFTSKTFYKNVHMLSHYNPHEEEPRYRIFTTIGSRGRGKTYSGKNLIANKFKFDPNFTKFAWIRLTDNACTKLLENNGSTFFENSILEKRKIDITTSNSDVFMKHSHEPDEMFQHKGKVLSLQNYYAWKGNNFDDYNVIIVDELVRASSERRTFNIPKAFVNTLETIVRERTDVIVLIYANAINEMGEIRGLFGFMPMPGNFGVYKLYHKRAIIEYLDDSKEWKKRKQMTLAGRLAQGMAEFSNVHKQELEDLNVFMDRKNLSRKNYILSIKLSIGPMWYDVYELNGKYVLDYQTYSPKSLQRSFYAGHRELVSKHFIYSPEVIKTFKDLWDRNKINYTNRTMFLEMKSIIINNKVRVI